MRRDLEFIEGLGKHHTDRAASVHQDTPNVEVRNVSPDNEWIVMGEDNTTLLLLAEGNGGPASPVGLWQSSLLGAEDLVRIGGADIMFDGVVGGASQGRTSADGGDHVDLSLVRVRRGWYVAHIVVQLTLPDEPFNYVAQRNTRLGVMAAELMKAAEDPRVWHRLVGWSPGGGLGMMGASRTRTFS